MASASGAFIRPWVLIDSLIRTRGAEEPGWHGSRLRRFHSPMGVDRFVDPYPRGGGAGLAWLTPPAIALVPLKTAMVRVWHPSHPAPHSFTP